MTWQDDLEREEKRLEALETKWEHNMGLIDGNLTRIDRTLSILSDNRTAIGEAEYSAQKAEQFRLRDINYGLRRQYLAKVVDFETSRQEIERTFEKCKELTHK